MIYLRTFINVTMCPQHNNTNNNSNNNKENMKKKKTSRGQVLMAHACNPSHSGDRSGGSPFKASPYLKNIQHTKKRWSASNVEHLSVRP
jgi:hypothetical protein